MDIQQKIKDNVKTTVSISAVAAALTLYTGVTQLLDQRYASAGNVEQVQQTIDSHLKNDLEDKVFIITMKEQEGTATNVDKAMKERYLRRLQEMKND